MEKININLQKLNELNCQKKQEMRTALKLALRIFLATSIKK